MARRSYPALRCIHITAHASISNGHRRDSRALCTNLQRSQRTSSYRPRRPRSPATRWTRFTIQPAIRLLFIRAALSLSFYTIYGGASSFSFARVPRIFVPFSETARAQLRFPGNFGGRALLAVLICHSIDPRYDIIITLDIERVFSF